MHIPHVYLATHGFRHGGPDPGHDPEGLTQISTMKGLLYLLNCRTDADIRLLVLGPGQRFEEMEGEICTAFPTIRVEYCPYFGGKGSISKQAGKEDEYDTGEDGTIPAKKVIEMFSLLSSAERWNVLKRSAKLSQGDTVVCVRGVILTSLGMEGGSGTVWKVNPWNRDRTRLMKDGHVIWPNVEVV